MSDQTIVMTARCLRCGSDGLVLMKRLDTGVVFARVRELFIRVLASRPDRRIFNRRPVLGKVSGIYAGGSRRWLGFAHSPGCPEGVIGSTEPPVVAAWFVLDRVALERVPWWAAEWLVQGYDGPNLRVLAGEHGDDIYKIRDLLPVALAEMQVARPVQPPRRRSSPSTMWRGNAEMV